MHILLMMKVFDSLEIFVRDSLFIVKYNIVVTARLVGLFWGMETGDHNHNTIGRFKIQFSMSENW